MRFDLVDLQLFVAVADGGSITAGADRVHLCPCRKSYTTN